MLIDEVERIWAPIADADDWSAFSTKKLAQISRIMADANGVKASRPLDPADPEAFEIEGEALIRYRIGHARWLPSIPLGQSEPVEGTRPTHGV